MSNHIGAKGAPARDVIERVTSSLDRLLSRTTEAVLLRALRHKEVIVLDADEYQAYLTTLEVMEDPGAMDDMRAGQEETHTKLPPPWEDVRQDLRNGSPTADDPV